MTKANNLRETENLQEHLQRVTYLLQEHRRAESLAHAQAAPSDREFEEEWPDKQNLAELQKLLDKLHPADIAHILEAMRLEDRLLIWDLVNAERDGEILLEVSDAVRETLIATMDRREMRAAAEQLDADEIADIASDFPRYILDDVFQSLPVEEREKLRAARSYSED
jgi:magnesium transporter